MNMDCVHDNKNYYLHNKGAAKAQFDYLFFIQI